MKPNVWYFIDWHDDLDRLASMQAVFVIAFKAAQSLAAILEIGVDYTEDIRLLSQGSLTFYDQDQGLFLSNGQISWASQAWMGLAQVLPQEQHVRAIQIAMQNSKAIKANTPYSYHYVLEALFKNGARDAGLALAKDYFGGMVDRGADTFWEAYREDDSTFSPYDDHHNNSFCHAWSCTVSWFLRL